MASRTYILTTSRRTPRPRSKRLRECGGGTYVTGGSVTYVSGGTSSGSSGGTSSGDIAELREELDALRTELEECCTAANKSIGELQDAVDSLRDMLGVVTFTIVPTPADATVTINGRERTAIEVFAGTTVTWSVVADGYITRTGSQEVTGDTTIEVALADIGSLISSFSYDDIGAGGGTVLPKVEALEGAALTYSGTGVDPATGAVGADSLGTTVKDRTRVTTVTLTAELNGSTATYAADVYQEKNEIVKHEAAGTTYSGLAITGGHAYGDIGAGGGTVTPTAPTYSQTGTTAYTDTYTSGATAQGESETETITSGATITYSGTGVNASTGAVTASSLGTTEKARSVVATATVTVTLNGESAGRSTDVYQAQNIIESESSGTTYSNPSVSLSYGEDIPAGGGTATPALSYSQTKTTGHSYTYSSGEVRTSDGETETITGGGTATYSGTGVASDGSVTASSLGTTLKERSVVATATVTVTLNGESGTATAAVYQEENKVESEITETRFDTPYILDLKWDDIPAGGGTVTPTFSVEQEAQTWTHRTYTSGATEDAVSETHSADTSGAALTFTASAGSADIDGTTGAVTAGSLGTEERERTRLGTYTVTAECNGVSSGAYTGEVWQEANEVISSTTERDNERLEIHGFEYPDVPAEGGTVYPTAYFYYYYTAVWKKTYTSGEVETERDTESEVRVTESDGVEALYWYGDGKNVTYLDGGAFTWDDAATSLERELLVTVNLGAQYVSPYSGETLYADATADVYQEPREAYLYFAQDTLTWDKAAQNDKEIRVFTNIDFTVESDSEWLRCYRETDNVVELRADYNEGYERTGTVTATGVGYPLTARLTITQEGEKVRPQIWFEDDETATEKTIELQAGGGGVTVAIGHSGGTEALELNSDWWGTAADGPLSVVIDGTEYHDYINFAKVGSPMIMVGEPADALSHPTRVLYLTATDYDAGAGNVLRININISE